MEKEIEQRIQQLKEKFTASGQDMVSYLDGLLYANYLSYWDYLHTDTLLTLQKPRTNFPDELIFIIYHQITELYFKLIQHEIDQITSSENWKVEEVIEKLKRINNYFRILTDSFDVMTNGMSQEQFLKFRMSLLPASGFQSLQFRMIEIKLTPLYQLTNEKIRSSLKSTSSVEELYGTIYWKSGNIDMASGRKTLTLEMFEKEYDQVLILLAHRFKEKNLFSLYEKQTSSTLANESLIREMKKLDANVNIHWKLSHYKSSVRHLQKSEGDIKATGGTNWQQYLPPRFQKIIFYPSLWTEQEQAEWGKAWVENL